MAVTLKAHNPLTGGSKVFIYEADVDPLQINAGAAGSVALTIDGVDANDYAEASPLAALSTGLVHIGTGASANTVTVHLLNPTAAPVNGADQKWLVKVYKVRG